MRPARLLGAVGAVAMAAVSACSFGGDSLEEGIPTPPPTRPTTTTTAPPDYSQVALGAPVAGRTTTTTIVLGPGQATLNGTAVSAAGPVPAATVRVERLMGTASASVELPTQADGTWALPGVLGGRYRVRAWRAPDLAMVQPALVFLGATDTLPVELKLERFAGPFPAPTITPARPVVDQPATLVVHVTQRSVDVTGIVNAVPLPNLRVALQSAGSWVTSTENPTLTDGTGRARWEVACRLPGPQPLTVVIPGAEPFPLALPPCVEAPPPAPPPQPGQRVRPGTATTRPGATTTTVRGATTTTARPATTATTRPRA